MELYEAIYGRRSIRDYKSEPVPKAVLEKILDAAIRAPSNSNVQPWEFIVLAGRKKQELDAFLDGLLKNATRGEREDWEPDPSYELLPEFRQRSGKLLAGLVAEVKAAGGDLGKLSRGSFNFFGAPCAIIAAMDRGHNVGAIMSVAAAIQNLLLAAHAQGLGACWEAMPLIYGTRLREYLGLPERKRLLACLALGYPADSPLNRFKSSREPLATFVDWRL
jgi:nitroreductase